MKLLKLIFLITLIFGCGEMVRAEGENFKRGEYYSKTWLEAINQPRKGDDEEYYPETVRINPTTLRRTLDEYFVNEEIIKESLCQGVDCYEWLESADDEYLKKYRVDLKYDASDSRLKLFWKNKF